jgi:flagellar assembly factor FliW
MLIKTKHFGEIDLSEDKIIRFENGIMGFENCKNYTILYDNDEGERPDISWLQSLDEPALALPVISPFLVKEDYNPEVEDEMLKPLGNISDDNIVILATITVPSDIVNMTANMKAPIIINAETKKGCQIIAENPDYEIKYKIYDTIKALKQAKEGK